MVTISQSTETRLISANWTGIPRSGLGGAPAAWPEEYHCLAVAMHPLIDLPEQAGDFVAAWQRKLPVERRHHIDEAVDADQPARTNDCAMGFEYPVGVRHHDGRELGGLDALHL